MADSPRVGSVRRVSRLTAPVVADAVHYADRWLAARTRATRLPGVQAAVWFEDGIALSTAHGVADLGSGEPLRTNHLFRIASHSKTFTATAVLQLVERGALRLDDPVGSRLDFLAGSPVADLTVRSLLGHASGLTRDGADSDYWQLARPFPDEVELQRVALDSAAVLGPDERFKYSNIAYGLLGLVVQAASGVPYATYVQTEVVDRLGLRDTGPEPGADRAHELATGHSSLAYLDHRLPIEHVDTRAMASATGFFSTASDVVTYASAHFAGDTRLLGAGAQRLMQRTELEVGDGDGAYGLGLGVWDVGGRRVLGHGGGYPGHITSTVFDPVARLAVSVLTNAIDGPAQSLAHGVVRLVDLAADHAAAERDDPAAAAPSAAELDRFTGRFANLWGVLDVVRLGGRLVGIDPSAVDPVAATTRFEPQDGTTLRVVETGGYGAPGETLRYVFADDGAVRSLQGAGGVTSYPLEVLSAALGDRTRVDLAGGGGLLDG